MEGSAKENLMTLKAGDCPCLMVAASFGFMYSSRQNHNT